MPLAIKDRLSFQLVIGDKEVKLEQNMLDFFHVVESVRINLPMMSIRIKDITKFFTASKVLVDGVPVTVSIGIKNKKLILPFRLFTHKERTVGGYTEYYLYSYLDAPRWWSESTLEIMNATSSQALSTLAQQCGMKYSGVSTNDQQIWIPTNHKRAEFAKKIAQHSYINDSSCCQTGVNLSRELRMVDVSQFKALKTVQAFSNVGTSNQSTITDYVMMNNSGFFNAISGYKDFLVNQSVLADDITTKSIDVTKNSAKLMMHKQIQKGIVQNRVSYAPIDVGNTNDKYSRAKYQNQRLGNLFSYGMAFLTNDLVTADLMDVVSCDMSKPGTQGVTPISGRYMVTSKVIYIENFNFYQKVEVARHGLDDAQTTNSNTDTQQAG